MCNERYNRSYFASNYLQDIFSKQIYNLRRQVLRELSQITHTLKYGIDSQIFNGAMLSNTLNYGVKIIDSVAAFKREIETSDRDSCLCTICNEFIHISLGIK